MFTPCVILCQVACVLRWESTEVFARSGSLVFSFAFLLDGEICSQTMSQRVVSLRGLELFARRWIDNHEVVIEDCV